MKEPLGRILVVDDDVDIANFIVMNLKLEGYEVAVAHTGADALRQVQRVPPDLVILDLMMPEMDGLEVTRRLRADQITSALPVIMLTAKGAPVDKVLGLNEGADDYIVKPFDTLELVARVRSTLRRTKEFREISPLTGLPGNTRILREVGDRLRTREDFAVCYCDIDGFKAVNDSYGFARGDEFIVTLARKLTAAVARAGLPPAFVGHVGGDDFVVICSVDQVRSLIGSAVAEFEAAADKLYDEPDRARGYITGKGRSGGIQQVGLVTVSVGVALSTKRVYDDPRELIAAAGEMKGVAKGEQGSYIAVDRRT